MEWTCECCDRTTRHEAQYISDINDRPQSHLSAKLTCLTCKTVEWGTDEIFDSHVCTGDGNFCDCNDTVHQHCIHCDKICNINTSIEP